MVLQNAMLQKYVVVVRTLEAAGEESRLFKIQTGNRGVLLGLTVCYTLGRNYAILKKNVLAMSSAGAILHYLPHTL